MAGKRKKTGKQAVSRRSNGQFAPGNTEGSDSRFKPGESGNPNGRRGSVVDALRRQLGEDCPDDRSRTHAEAIAEKLISLAEAGEVPAIRELLDRIEGKPRQALDIDMSLLDWRQLAQLNGLDLHEVLAEARRLIETAHTDDAD
ncbi:MAG TPA: DUF5681 domain-containing protein [Blastocatellia bacterium]|nr:DUF5681 domain-containing protein [Blastocatellia bacterium]